MTSILDSNKLTQLETILAQWDIPPIQSIEAFDDDHPVFKIISAGQTFTLKDISDAPDLLRLEFTREVLTHVARSGLCVPVPLLSRSAQYAVSFQGRFYLLSEFIQADKPPSEPELQPELFYQIGHAIALLHQSLASFPDTQVSRRTWRQDLAGDVAAWLSSLSAGLPEPQAAVVKRVGIERGASMERALQGLPEHWRISLICSRDIALNKV